VPKDLRPLYGGKDSLPARSLKTLDLAAANSLARARLADYEREFKEKRAALNGGSPASKKAVRRTLSPETIERLAAGYRAKLIDQDFARRVAAYDHAVADPEAFWRGEIIPEPNDWKTFKGRPYSYWVYLCDDPETPLETGIAYALHARREVRLAEVKQALCLGKTDLLGSEADALLASYEHEGSDRLRLVRRLMEVEIAAQTSLLTEQAVNFPPAGTEYEDDRENPLLSAAAQSWLEEKKSLGLTARRIEDCEGAVALFIEVIGDRPIANYTKGNLRDFKNVLRALPPNRSKIRATRSLDARSAAKEAQRLGLPLILLNSGARVNEACKLRVIDIGEENGIPFFNIAWEEEDGTGIAGRVKNISRERKVPIHGDLVRFGFLEFVARARSRGTERLFPELKPNRHGKLYQTISQRFSDTFLPGLGIKTDKTSLKSFCHNFVDAARNSRLSDPVIQALKGDTYAGTLGRYGHGKTDLEILADEMKKLHFKGLDLSHLANDRNPSKLTCEES